jgi:hypothetical protein
MTITIPCPQCRKALRIASAYAGRSMLCPNCSFRFVVPDAVPVAAEPEAPVADNELAKPDEEVEYVDGEPEEPDEVAIPLSPGWNTVRGGLGLLRASVLTLTLMTLVPLTAALLIFTLPWLALALSLTAVCAMFIDLLLILVALVMLCAAPSESRNRGLALGTVLCVVLGIIVSGAAIAYLVSKAFEAGRRIPHRPRFGPVPAHFTTTALFLFTLAGLIVFAGYLLHLLFLRRTARCFGDEPLAQNVNHYLLLATMVGLIIFGYAGALLSGVIRMRPRLEPGEVLLAVVTFASGILATGWYIYLLGRVRDTIGTKPRHRPEE